MGPAGHPISLAGVALPDGLRFGDAVASGASGTVYRGWHPRAGAVAVKVSHADDDWNALRLMREANAAAAIDDPAVVRVVACGRLADGRAWVAMEWIDGVTLEEALSWSAAASGRGSSASRRVWPAARILGVGAQLARALAAAHAVGVVHRDLKPSNVMVRIDSGRVVVVDWGIAWRAGDPASSASRFAGTPHYMAPEQALGEDADARTDLYALGCVLARMWTGRVPFEGSSVEVMLGHLGAAPPALDGAPPAFAALVARLLAKRPDDRPRTAAEVAATLEHLAATASEIEPAIASDTETDSAAVASTIALATINPFGATVPVPTLPRPAARPSRRRALGLIAVAALALGASSFSTVRWLDVAPTAAIAPVVSAPAPSAPRPVIADEQVIVLADGASNMRATVRGLAMAGGTLQVALELWDEDEQPLTGPGVAATLRAPGGTTTALTLTGTTGILQVRAALADAGEHILTVFAPSGETTFAMRISVGDRPQS